MQNQYRPEGMLSGSVTNRELLSLGRAGLERAMLNGTILESTALLCDEEMNLHVDLRGIEGIIPREEVCYCRDGETIKDIAIITRVGKPVCFKVMAFGERDGRMVAYLSRRAAQIECMNNYISDLIPGDIVCSRVTHLEPFGAFVDIGVHQDGLVHISQISDKFIKHPSEVLAVGDVVKVTVLSVDLRKKRIGLTMKGMG